jgi:hypothetical protein
MLPSVVNGPEAQLVSDLQPDLAEDVDLGPDFEMNAVTPRGFTQG